MAKLARISEKHNLSEGEQAILEKLLEGKSNSEIAEVLQLARNTVKCHLYRIYRKLGVKTGRAAIVYCLSGD